jgi:galactokinase
MPSTETIADLVEQEKPYACIAGMDRSVIRRKKALARRVLGQFLERFGHRREVCVYHVPGRLEFTGGKHTDYVGLPVPNFAIDRGFLAIAAPADTPNVTMIPTGYCYPGVRFALEDLAPDVSALEVPYELQEEGQGMGNERWRNYPITMLQRIRRNFSGIQEGGGIDVVFGSDLPPASGMSSSSALMIMTFIVFAGSSGLLDRTRFRRAMEGDGWRSKMENLALYLACCENGSRFENPVSGVILEGREGVGTFGGSQDHVAILLGKKGHMGINDFCPIRHMEEVPWPDDLGVAVCYAMPASKTEEARCKFNALRHRADEVSRAVSEWLDAEGQYGRAGEIVKERPDLDASAVSRYLRSRSEFREKKLAERWEMAYIQSRVHLPEVIETLRAGDYQALGCLTSREHAMSWVNLGNITPLIDAVQKCALSSGALGATGFGGGFGGSLFALTEREEMTDFLQDWEARSRSHIDAYRQAASRQDYSPAFFPVQPASGACQLFVEDPRILS